MKQISQILSTVTNLADDLITTKEEVMKAEHEDRKLEVSLQEGQMRVNEKEAQHKSVFVSGWRPAVGWIGGFSLLYAAIVYPLMVFVAKINGYTEELPELDTTITMQVLFGILGLGAYRTHEKGRRIETNSIKSPRKKRKGLFSFLKRKK